MKAIEDTPKEITYTLHVNQEEAEAIMALTGSCNSVGQDVTYEIFRELNKILPDCRWDVRDHAGRTTNALTLVREDD